MKIELKPTALPMKLRLCPPGLFLFKNTVGFKDEYGGDPYCADSGEYFWGDTEMRVDRDDLEVIPLESVRK